MTSQVLWQVEFGLGGKETQLTLVLLKRAWIKLPDPFLNHFSICWRSGFFWYDSVLALCEWVRSNVPKWMRRRGHAELLKLGLPWQIWLTGWVAAGSVCCWQMPLQTGFQGFWCESILHKCVWVLRDSCVYVHVSVSMYRLFVCIAGFWREFEMI